MKVHLFNPEHEIALAMDKAIFTPSHNVTKMRRELAFLPLLWAEPGDIVLVEDTEFAYKAANHFSSFINKGVSIMGYNRFRAVAKQKVATHCFDLEAAPWGWDKAVKHLLMSLGWPENKLPSDEFLEQVRNVSHRRVGKEFLEKTGSRFVAYELTTVNDIIKLIEEHGDVVLKSPWSCSGRGIRFVNKDNCTPSLLRWIDNIISQQGSIMLEPHYNKLRDFAMEFEALDGVVKFVGFSIFDTCYTAYSSSLITTEERKREILELYIFPDEIDETISCLEDYLTKVIPEGYVGGIGVDMMVVKQSEGFLLHPCVEINLRRTMGHVALSFETSDDLPDRNMIIDFARNFELCIK
ncbi:MAG: hypothetical protein HUK07_02330 [Bacteroidaceae bacterium]|nr:hypothetical protein [Bacteroidaceae bacterium]